MNEATKIIITLLILAAVIFVFSIPYQMSLKCNDWCQEEGGQAGKLTRYAHHNWCSCMGLSQGLTPYDEAMKELGLEK